MTRHRALGLAQMAGAGVAWSTGGILVRQLSFADGWEIVFWRSLFMLPWLALAVVVSHRGRVIAPVRAVGRAGWIAGGFLAIQFFRFLLAVTHTTVAETLVIMSMAPFADALVGRLWLAEPVRLRTWLAMAAGFAGIVLMFASALGGGGALGNLIGGVAVHPLRGYAEGKPPQLHGCRPTR